MNLYLIESLEHSRDGVKMWWKPNEVGYTPYVHCAGRFTEERAKEIVAASNVKTLSERMWTEDEVLNELAGELEVVVRVTA